MADVATVAEENIVGVHVVKAFAQEQAEQDKFEAALGDALRARACARTGSARSTCRMLAFLPLLAQAAVLLVGGKMVQDGSMRSASSSRSTSGSSMVIFPLRMLGMWIGEGQRATASGERIFQVIDEAEDIRDRPGAGLLPEGPGLVRFDGVTFGYDPDRPVLSDDRPRAGAREDGGADRAHRVG